MCGIIHASASISHRVFRKFLSVRYGSFDDEIIGAREEARNPTGVLRPSRSRPSTQMRITSLTASASTVGRLCEDIARKATAFRPDAILWVSNNTSDPQAIARAFADQCHACVGGISQHGLVGGGREYMTAASSMGDQHAVALALSLPSKGGGGALPFHSDCEGLPHLPASAWEEFVAAPPAQSPNLLMLASPPAEGHFAIEHWLSRLDTALPWARKVGGVTVGDSRLFVGETQHDGGAVGLALTGVEVDTLVCHGALPFGPSFEITAATGAMVRELDGRPVGEVIGPLLQEVAAAQGAAAAVGGSGGGRVVATAASDGNGATAPAAAPPPPHCSRTSASWRASPCRTGRRWLLPAPATVATAWASRRRHLLPRRRRRPRRHPPSSSVRSRVIRSRHRSLGWASAQRFSARRARGCSSTPSRRRTRAPSSKPAPKRSHAAPPPRAA